MKFEVINGVGVVIPQDAEEIETLTQFMMQDEPQFVCNVASCFKHLPGEKPLEKKTEVKRVPPPEDVAPKAEPDKVPETSERDLLVEQCEALNIETKGKQTKTLKKLLDEHAKAEEIEAVKEKVKEAEVVSHDYESAKAIAGKFLAVEGEAAFQAILKDLEVAKLSDVTDFDALVARLEGEEECQDNLLD